MWKRRLLGTFTALLLAVSAQAAREIKPGFNLFSREQDVQLGRETSQEIEKQVRVVRDSELQNYITQLGNRLAKVSPAPDYPYTFKVVADKNINAFALPGGPIYVNSGTIAAAENEAQLAGVIAHEISHVALRHSTNQASKAYAWQIPLAIAGGALGGSGSLLGQLAQIGVGFGLNSVLLKYSRDAEHDADIIGAHTMAKAGYDPVEMARFFQKLEAQGGSGAVQFLSSHPNPGNRVQYVEAEVRTMPAQRYTSGSSADFTRARQIAAKVPTPPPQGGYNDQPSQGHPHPEFPSGDFRDYQGRGFRFAYPSNWRVYGKQNDASVTIAPSDGLVRDPRGQVQIGMGAMAGYFSPESNSIPAATDDLLQDLRSHNPDLRPIRGQRDRRVIDGSEGEVMLLTGVSPFGSAREIDSLLTVLRPEGLFYLILIVPEQDSNSLRPTFDAMQHSVRFR